MHLQDVCALFDSMGIVRLILTCMTALEFAHVSYSYKQPSCFTFTVLPSALQDSQQWQLPAFNLRNEKKYMYPLNTVDIYFWHQDGAELFLESVKKISAIGGLNIHNAPPSQVEHGDMSPVVQKLEQAANTSPYHQLRSQSTSTVRSFTPPQPDNASTIGNTHHTTTATSAMFVPVAYNPAAPAAPEPITYREKTPPPVDACTGTGLTAAAVHEQGVPASFGQYQQQYQYTQQQPHAYSWNPQQRQTSFSQPPWQHQGSFPPPPPQNGTATSPGELHRMSSLPPPPSNVASPPPQQLQQYHSAAQSYTQPISVSPSQSMYNSHRQPPIPSLQGGPPQQQHATYSPSSGQAPLRSPGIQSATYQPLPQSPGFAPPPRHSPAFLPPPLSPTHQQPLQSPGFAIPPPPQSPLYAPHTLHSPPQSTPPSQQQQQPPIPYSTYSYSNQQPLPTPETEPDTPNPYAIHSQAYIPTAQEASAHKSGNHAKAQFGGPHQDAQSGPGSSQAQGQGTAAGRLEARADRLEKGVNRFLKRLDKKF